MSWLCRVGWHSWRPEWSRLYANVCELRSRCARCGAVHPSVRKVVDREHPLSVWARDTAAREFGWDIEGNRRLPNWPGSRRRG